MKNVSISHGLMVSAVALYAADAQAHSHGEHGGGLVQQISHIIQSADHLFIILALAVVVSLLLRQLTKYRN